MSTLLGLLLLAAVNRAVAAVPRPLLAQGITISDPGTSSKSYVVDAVIVAAASGGALFAVCKSSRRV